MTSASWGSILLQLRGENKHDSHCSVHLKIPNATAVRGSHHRSPWQQSLCDSADRLLAGTGPLIPGTACYSSQRSTAGILQTRGTSWAVGGQRSEFLTYPDKGDYLRLTHVLHYKSKPKEEKKNVKTSNFPLGSEIQIARPFAHFVWRWTDWRSQRSTPLQLSVCVRTAGAQRGCWVALCTQRLRAFITRSTFLITSA